MVPTMSFFGKIWPRKSAKGDSPVHPSDPIDAFWHWWARASDELAASYDSGKGLSDEQIDEISSCVHSIDEGLAWETGPGVQSRHSFALSSDGNPALRVLTQRWLARAPQRSAAWEYYPARQASGADPKSTLRINGNEFDFSEFRLSLERDETRAVIHVGVYHPVFAQIDEDARSQPAYLFLDDALGEDAVESWVGSIDILTELPSPAATSGALKEEVLSLKTDWDDEQVTGMEGERGGKRIVALARLGLKRLDHLFHDHHWSLSFTFNEPGEAGLGTTDENTELNALEDAIIETLGPRIIWIGHENCGGERVIHFHAAADAAMQDELMKICAAHGEWDPVLGVEPDPAWEILRKY